MKPVPGAIFFALVSFAAMPMASADVLINVDKASQRLTVTVDGVRQYDWPVSTARAGYITPDGEYRPTRLDRTWFSRKYYNSPMPYSIFFHGGYAIHGSFERAEIGRPASHGCVRLDPKNAEVLFDLVKAQGADNTRIVIGGPQASDIVAAHSKYAPHLNKMDADQNPQAPSYRGRFAYHNPRIVYVRRPPARFTYSGGAPPLVDPFSELISYVRNHDE